MLKSLLRRPWVQAVFAALLGRYLAFALRTTRWTLHGEAYLGPHVGPHPAIGAFWHERLPLMPALWTLVHARSGGRSRAHVLVSRHNDGRFIGEVVRRFNLEMVHGSTRHKGRDRGGAAGARTLLGVLQAGDHVVITPDGPRGPRRVAAPGWRNWPRAPAFRCCLARRRTSRRWMLPSWDRMVLPLPFGRGVIVCGEPIAVPGDGAEVALPRIEAAITAATEQADRLCG